MAMDQLELRWGNIKKKSSAGKKAYSTIRMCQNEYHETQCSKKIQSYWGEETSLLCTCIPCQQQYVKFPPTRKPS